MKRLILFLVATAAFAVGVPQNVTCLQDDTPAMWVNGVRYVNGHSFYGFQCMMGHKFWVRGD